MKILIIDNSKPIPVKKYGGTERVIWSLGKELSKLGHDVYYLVKEGSYCDFATVLTYKEDVDLDSQIPEEIDVVHLNFSTHKKITSKPYLITMHGNPGMEETINKNVVFISKNQAKRYGSLTYVYNGLDWDDYPIPKLNSSRKYLHFLGKVDWKIKNVFGAVKVAIQSKNKIHIMGGNRWTFRNLKRGGKYLFNPNIIFRGMVDNDTKIDIMQNSKALIFPVLWHEPFGLAIIESLYAGCAVFGTKNGALEELITPEIGNTSNNSKELASAIKTFDYDPLRCHTYALENFNSKIMTLAYLKLYKKVIAGEPLNQEHPKYIAKENTISKLV